MFRNLLLLFPLLLFSATLRAADSPVRLTDLTAEHQPNPLGIGTPQPRLSWKLASDRTGEKQTAYEIRTAVSPADLSDPAAFDTGKVPSDQSDLVPWPGKPFPSRQRTYWQVRIWDKDGNPTTWSDPASIEMGLLNPQADWKAQWITVDLPRIDIEQQALAKANWISAGSTATQAAAVRTTFTLPAGAVVQSAVFDAAADGLIALFVNGKPIRQGSSSHTAPFHADFAQQLVPGKNIIAISSLAVRNAGRGRGAANPGKNAIAAHGTIALQDGTTVEFNTDATWKAAIPPTSPPTGNWSDPDFDDSAWASATVLDKYTALPPIPSADGTLGPARYLRKSFDLKGPVAKARLYATALGTYEASINGKPVSPDQFAPGWTDYTKRVMVQTYDVTSLLNAGSNTLGAILTDGWFAGRVGWMGLNQYSTVGTRPAFAAQLEITYADGTTDTLITDDSWRGGPGEILCSDMQLGEIIDKRRVFGTDARSVPPASARWGLAVLIEKHEGISLDPQVGPPVRALMELPPQKITRRGNTWLVDFGQNLVGHVRLMSNPAAPGTTIQVTHGEMLNPDGTLYTENLRPAISLDTFILSSGSQLESSAISRAALLFEPRFTFHGFRYAQITGFPGELRPDQIRAIVVGSDCPPAGTFECSNPDVNRLYQNIVWGQRGNFLSVPTDCPQRDERMGWMGDAQVFAPTAAMNANVAGFFAKWMIDVNDAQGRSGEFSTVAPRANQNNSWPVWGDAGVIIPWAMYTAYGDKAFLESNYAHMAAWVDYNAQRNPTFLLTGGVGDHLAPVGTSAPGSAGGSRGARAPRGPASTAATASAPATRGNPAARGRGFAGINTTTVVDTAYFAHSADLVARSAKILGRAQDAAKFDQLFHEIADAFNKTYVQPDGTIQAGTQTTYILALQFNLLPENLRPAAAQHLADDVQQRGHVTTGFVGVGLINPALTAIGRSDLAYQLLLTDTYPSWLFPIRHGATTIWERWDGWTPDRGFQDSSMNSFNHYSLGSVGLWFYTGIAGIALDEARPGYKHFFLRPQITPKLTYAKATYASPYGTISSSWRLEGDHYIYDAIVPPNSTANVSLPAAVPGYAARPGNAITLDSGTYHWTFAASAVK